MPLGTLSSEGWTPTVIRGNRLLAGDVNWRQEVVGGKLVTQKQTSPGLWVTVQSCDEVSTKIETIESPDGSTYVSLQNTLFGIAAMGFWRMQADAAGTRMLSNDATAHTELKNGAYRVYCAGRVRMIASVGAGSILYSDNTNTYVGVTDGSVYGNTAYSNVSDKRMKIDYQDIPDALLDVWADHVKPSSYKMIADGAEGKRMCGVYAQDVIAAFDAAGLDWKDWGVVKEHVHNDEPARYMVSYNDVMAIEMALMRRKLAKIA
jgi:hypothetical protein